jgi:hypothetical protein
MKTYTLLASRRYVNVNKKSDYIAEIWPDRDIEVPLRLAKDFKCVGECDDK